MNNLLNSIKRINALLLNDTDSFQTCKFGKDLTSERKVEENKEQDSEEKINQPGENKETDQMTEKSFEGGGDASRPTKTDDVTLIKSNQTERGQGDCADDKPEVGDCCWPEALPLERESEAVRVARVALMECYNVLILLGPWCCGRVAETLMKPVKPSATFTISF